MAFDFVESSQELSKRVLIPDTRAPSTRVAEWLADPLNFGRTMLGLGVLAMIALPWLALPMAGFMALALLMHGLVQHPLPARYPKDLGGLDPSHAIADRPGGGSAPKPADGIFFLGNERSRSRARHDREIWWSGADLTTHLFMTGATGSGKTETLLGLCANTLMWGSGFSYSDAKAQNTLSGKVYTLLRRLYRDDDYRLINYITGASDPFSARRDPLRHNSNSANIFSEAPMDFINELLVSMLPKADGQGAQWQQKAINMMRAIVRIACYQRSVGERPVSVTSLRDMMSLPSLEKLYDRGERGDLPEVAFGAIRTYLITGISWNPEKHRAGKPQTDEVRTQHGYLTGQFLAPLSMLADTYGHIYTKTFPEVDMADVMLRRRICVVMIPPLEKSPQEAANLGKLNIGAQRLMMAQNLGSMVEGSYRDIFASNATVSPTPYMIVWDELGYQFAPGVDVVCAQARSLNFSIVAAGQDLAAMKKEGKEEVDTLIANTRIKISLALEDPQLTFDLFSKIAGEAHYYRASGTERTPGLWMSGFAQTLSNSVEKAARVTLQELQGLDAGQGLAVWKGRIIRFNAFYPFGDIKPMRESDPPPGSDLPPGELARMKKMYRLVRFLQVYPTEFESISAKCKPLSQDDSRANALHGLREIMQANESPFRWQPQLVQDSGPLQAIAQCAARLPAGLSPLERGIALYMAGVDALGRPDSAATAGAPRRGGGPSEGQSPGRSEAPDEEAREGTPILVHAASGNDLVFDALAYLDSPSLVAKASAQEDRPPGPPAAPERAAAPPTPLPPRHPAEPAESHAEDVRQQAAALGLLQAAAELPPTAEGAANLWLARAIATGAQRRSRPSLAQLNAPDRDTTAEAPSGATAQAAAAEQAAAHARQSTALPILPITAASASPAEVPPAVRLTQTPSQPDDGGVDALTLSDEALAQIAALSAEPPPLTAGLTQEALERIAQIELEAGTTSQPEQAIASAQAVESAIAQAVAEAAGSIRNAQTASLDEIELLFNQIAAAVEGKAGEAGGRQP